jgi:uncharacterized protein (DUF2141 family)
MKIFMTILFVFGVFLSVSFAQDSTITTIKNGSLLLNVFGFANDEGKLRIALSDTKEDYTSEGSNFKTDIVPIKNKTAQSIFSDLPFGTYAIKIFHDENENGELDTNFLGIPSEDYGFSNNAKGSFGPASWEDAQFTFDKDSMNIQININE